MGRFLFLVPAAISEASKVHLPFSWAVERQAAHMGKWTRSAKVLGLRLEPPLQGGHQTKYWLLWKEDSPGCHEEGGATDTAHPRGHWAICSVNSALVVIWPPNNVHLSDPGYNLPHSCVAPRAFLFSPHLEEIFFLLERSLHFSQTLLSNALLMFQVRLWKTKMGRLLLFLLHFIFVLEIRERMLTPSWL